MGPNYKEGTKFPLVLVWICTVHKEQGLRLISAYISFDLEKQKLFNEGQMYFDLSRVSSIDNLFFVGRYKCNAFKVNENSFEYKK